MDREKQALILKTLGDTYRLDIMQALKEQGRPLSVEEIAALICTTHTHTGYHLKQLKMAGLLTSKKQGQRVYYRVESRVVIEAYTTLLGLLPAETVAS